MFSDIDINYKAIYLFKKDGSKLEVKMKEDSRVGLDVSEECSLKDDTLDKIVYH